MAATRQEIEALLSSSKLWEKTKNGAYIYILKTGRKLKIRFSQMVVRLEIQITHEATEYTAQSKSWVRVAGGYYKDVSIFSKPEGRIVLKINGQLLNFEHKDCKRV